MSQTWVIVSGLLYVLGVRLAYLALEPFDDAPLWATFAWPLLIVSGIATDLWHCTVGDWLWRRRHAKWCAESRTKSPDKPTGAQSRAEDRTQ